MRKLSKLTSSSISDHVTQTWTQMPVHISREPRLISYLRDG